MRSTARGEYSKGGTRDTNRVKTVVLVVARVFGRNHRFDQLFRHFFQLERDAALFTKLGDQFAVLTEDLHRSL
ncbi:Uncharacterised protein [Vibrio cholerae]|nr:Uncharacterised protein [Vibrio cholerae]